MLVRIATRTDPDQKQYDVGLHCLPRPLWKTTIVGNFTTFTIRYSYTLFIIYPALVIGRWQEA